MIRKALTETFDTAALNTTLNDKSNQMTDILVNLRN